MLAHGPARFGPGRAWARPPLLTPLEYIDTESKCRIREHFFKSRPSNKRKAYLIQNVRYNLPPSDLFGGLIYSHGQKPLKRIFGEQKQAQNQLRMKHCVWVHQHVLVSENSLQQLLSPLSTSLQNIQQLQYDRHVLKVEDKFL